MLQVPAVVLRAFATFSRPQSSQMAAQPGCMPMNRARPSVESPSRSPLGVRARSRH